MARKNDSQLREQPGSEASEVERKLLALLESHRSGNPEAMNELMEQLFPLVRRFVFRVAGARDAHTREDLVQSALEETYRSTRRYEGRSRFTTFVYGICYRVVLHAHRRERIRRLFQRSPPELPPSEADGSPEAVVDRQRAVEEARLLLDALDAEERAAFVLHEVEESSQEEIAASLGCSTRTVKRRLRAARQKLSGGRS